MFISLITAPIYWRTEYSFINRRCEANIKNPRSPNWIRSASPIKAACLIRCANILAQWTFLSSRLFRSFQLSGCSWFTVILAFRSFRLFGHSSFSSVLGALRIWEIEKGEAERIFALHCLLFEKSPINLAVASGNGNKIFTGKQHDQKDYKPRSPLSDTSTWHLPPSRPPSILVTICL